MREEAVASEQYQVTREIRSILTGRSLKVRAGDSREVLASSLDQRQKVPENVLLFLCGCGIRGTGCGRPKLPIP